MSSIRSSSSALRGHVAVERHRARAEPLRDAAHRERLEALLVGERDRGLDDPLDVRPGLGPRAAALASPPEELEADPEIAASGGHRGLDEHPDIAYGVLVMAYSVPDLAIEAKGLVKRYGSTVALDGLDLAVPAGTVCGLLGPNGAGKTTAVRILSTLLRLEGGSARVAGLRRGAGGSRGALPDRPDGPEGRGRGRAHRAPEPRDVRAALPPVAAGRAAARGRVARALRARRRGAQAGEAVLGRHAPPARPRGELHPRAAGAVPGRADDRAGPAQPQRGLGRGALVRRRRDDRAAHDALPRRGRPTRRPDLGDRPRARDRGRHAGRAEGARRRLADRRGRARGRRRRGGGLGGRAGVRLRHRGRRPAARHRTRR